MRGGRGIGAGIAQSLAKAGADVVIADMTATLANEGSNAIKALGRKSAAIVVDVRERGFLGQFSPTFKYLSRLSFSL